MSTQMMKALVKREAAKGIWLEQVTVPQPGPNEVLIKLEKTAICGTDLHIYLWDEWSQRTIKPGLVIGHEFVGRIVEIGPGVTGYALGQRVSAEGHIVCGHCRNCRAGRQHLCPNTVGIGVNRDGAFAEYIVMPATNLWPIPDQIPSELAAFFDPYGNAAHCALEFDVVGEDVLITGAGPIGVMAAGICKHIGARNVVVTDVNDYRLKLAADMGATRVVNVSNTSLKDVMADLHMEGFDVGLEMSGHPRAFNDMLDCMYHGGKIALLGILPKGTGVDWDKIIFKGLTVTYRIPESEIYKCTGLDNDPHKALLADLSTLASRVRFILTSPVLQRGISDSVTDVGFQCALFRGTSVKARCATQPLNRFRLSTQIEVCVHTPPIEMSTDTGTQGVYLLNTMAYCKFADGGLTDPNKFKPFHHVPYRGGMANKKHQAGWHLRSKGRP